MHTNIVRFLEIELVRLIYNYPITDFIDREYTVRVVDTTQGTPEISFSVTLDAAGTISNINPTLAALGLVGKIELVVSGGNENGIVVDQARMRGSFSAWQLYGPADFAGKGVDGFDAFVVGGEADGRRVWIGRKVIRVS